MYIIIVMNITEIIINILSIIVIGMLIICVYDLIVYEPDLSNSAFSATSKYADVEFTTNSLGNEMNIVVQYKDLEGVSAIHIHENNNGTAGPIIAWLATSEAWQNGVAQNKPQSNGNCCTSTNPECSLIAPSYTPRVSTLSNKKRSFIVKKPNKSCTWLSGGALLVVHGPKFQQTIRGILTKGKPGLDVISLTTFIRL